jgi:uncharacterized protein (DUF58 family)
MFRSRRITVSREGVYYAAVVVIVFSGALFRQVNLLLVLAGLISGPLLVGWWMAARTLRGLSVRRKLPKHLAAGDTLVCGLTLENPRRRLGAWAVVVEDCVRRESETGSAKPLRPSVIFPYVSAGQDRTGAYRGQAPRRGRYRFGPIRISTRFPFGLFGASRVVDEIGLLTVVPRLGQLMPGWSARRRQAFAGTHRRERRHGPEGDLFGLRAWRSGDSRRWIHWRSSARHGALMVRELEQPRNRDVALLLDLWEPAEASVAHRENTELAVSFAATVAADLCRRGGGSLSLLTTDARQTPLSGPATASLLNEVLERLADVEPSVGDRTAALVEQALATVEPGTELVLVGTRPVELASRERFPSLAGDPRRLATLQQILAIDTSSETLRKYFVVE